MSNLRLCLYTLLAALVIFAQGLYFSDQWLVALVFCLGAVAYVRMKDGPFANGWTVTGLFLVCNLLLSISGYLYYQERGMLVFSVLLWIFYIAFYRLLTTLSEDRTRDLTRAFIYAMAIACAVTILAYLTGWGDAYGLVIDGRVSGPLQYANTFGILSLSALILSIPREDKPYLLWAVRIVLTVGIILTMSRAVYLVSLTMLMSALILKKANKATILQFITSIIIGIVVLRLFDASDTAARLTVTTQASEWQTRLLYYKDAIGMILDRPWGFGFNGYHYAQSFYQTGSTYHVKFVHSSLLQAALDRGLIGGLIMGLWMAFMILQKHLPTENRLVLLGILGHSLIDINLEFPIVWLLILLMTVEEPILFHEKKTARLLTYFSALFIGTIALYMWQASYAYEQKDYEKAIKIYPYYTEAYRKLLKDNDDLALVSYAKEAIAINPYMTESYEILASEALERLAFEEGISYLRDLVIYSPLLIEHHEAYSHGLIYAATYRHAYGDDEDALRYIDEIMAIPDSLTKLAKERDTDYNVKHKPDLTMTRSLNKDFQEALWLKSIILNKVE